MQENVTELEGNFEKFPTHVHSGQGGKHPVPNLRGRRPQFDRAP
jgi:hypothetical protein